MSLLLQRFQGEFLRAFRALYLNPSTRIKIPGCNSDVFRLGRGIRQGCPLFPLIFALAIEPLAIAILQHPDISGYGKAGSEYMCVDDVLLFLTNPIVTLPNLLRTLSTFADISGLSVSKSLALEALKKSFSFSAQSSLPLLPWG